MIFKSGTKKSNCFTGQLTQTIQQISMGICESKLTSSKVVNQEMYNQMKNQSTLQPNVIHLHGFGNIVGVTLQAPVLKRIKA